MSGDVKRTPLQEIWMRLKRNKVAVVSMIIIIILLLMAIFAGLLLDYEEDAIKQNIANRLKPPSAEHWFGTDQYGRDLFSRVVFGSRISLSIGVVATFFAMGTGIVFGAVAGYFGGWVDNIIMRITDIFLAIPAILLAIAIVAVLGTNVVNLIMAIAVAYAPGYVRVVKAAVIRVKGNEYIEAARALGANPAQVIFKHLVLNSIDPIIVQATLGISSIIIAAAALSYVGLGAQPPVPEWGSMLSGGKEFMRTDPYIMIFPGLFIFLSSLSFNLFGDGLRDALDPKLKQ